MRRVERLLHTSFSQQVAKGRIDPAGSAWDRRITEVATRVLGGPHRLHVLVYTPDEDEDFVVLLVDDREVLGFAIARHGADAAPSDVERHTIGYYRGRVRGSARHALDVAEYLARRELSG